METAFTFCDSCNPNAKIIGQEGRGYVGLPKSSVREFGWGQIDGKDICAECIEEQGLIIPKSISSQILHKNTKLSASIFVLVGWFMALGIMAVVVSMSI